MEGTSRASTAPSEATCSVQGARYTVEVQGAQWRCKVQPYHLLSYSECGGVEEGGAGEEDPLPLHLHTPRPQGGREEEGHLGRRWRRKGGGEEEEEKRRRGTCAQCHLHGTGGREVAWRPTSL